MENLFHTIPADLPAELFDTLLESGSVRIERIVSRGHATPAGQWYDQDRHEWVLLLQGAARLAFADGRELELGPGDWLEIPARQRHRVAWTDPAQDTVWLAVHYA
ncbi:MAG: cupin domain-containing protein [Lysobacterales bacterium]|nr:MAG: cupin domain-containing protein [Xanthomonadales bacterium]